MDRQTSVGGWEYIGGAGRLFSVHQAQRALVLVRRIVADAAAAYSHVVQTQGVLERMQRCGPIEEINRLQGEMVGSAEVVQNC